MGVYDQKPCPCGSGKLRWPNWDARGIFLRFTCDDCHKEKMKGYRREVLADPNYDAPDLGDDEEARRDGW